MLQTLQLIWNESRTSSYANPNHCIRNAKTYWHEEQQQPHPVVWKKKKKKKKKKKITTNKM
jgi:hypothetical protein